MEAETLEHPQTALEQAVKEVATQLDAVEGGGTPDKAEYWAAAKSKDDVVVSVGVSRYPMPSQASGWQIPERMREYALATLWRIMRSQTAAAAVKVRAVEALVRIDAQSLASERADDWREVQASKSTRSNVRVLAEFARRGDKGDKPTLPKP